VMFGSTNETNNGGIADADFEFVMLVIR
jgi:hypothetical protein